MCVWGGGGGGVKGMEGADLEQSVDRLVNGTWMVVAISRRVSSRQ